MIAAVAALLLCQLAGEILVRALMLPLPGPVAGLGLLFGFLVLRGRGRADPDDGVPVELGRVCDVLLKNLSLLFVPAAVGVVQYVGLLRTYAGSIAAVIAVSTTAAMIITAVTFRFVSRLHAFRHKPLVADLETAAGLEPADRLEHRP